MGGRPTSLTDEVKGIICSHLANGATYQIACQAAGITRATAYNWKARGEAGEANFDEFLDEVERARARFEVLCLQRLNALDDDGGRSSGSVVKALTWLLERTRNDRYGPVLNSDVRDFITAAHIQPRTNGAFLSLDRAPPLSGLGAPLTCRLLTPLDPCLGHDVGDVRASKGSQKGSAQQTRSKRPPFGPLQDDLPLHS